MSWNEFGMRKTQENQGFQGIHSKHSKIPKKYTHPKKLFALPADAAYGGRVCNYFLEFWNFGILGEKPRKIKAFRHSKSIPNFEIRLIFGR